MVIVSTTGNGQRRLATAATAAGDTMRNSIYYGAEWPNHKGEIGKFSLENGYSFADGFHRFALEWDPEEMRWYVDDQLVAKRQEWYSSAGEYPAPFDQRFHLLINLAVGGRLSGPPDASTEFPQSLIVDYVRIYERIGAEQITARD